MPSQPYPLKKLMLSILLVLAFVLTISVHAQDKSAEVAQKLSGFDAFMEKTLKDWNAPGIGVGIVVNDKLVFARGYGYRVQEFADSLVEFVEENGRVTALKQIDPSGEYVSKRK